MNEQYTNYNKRWKIITTKQEDFNKFKIGVINNINTNIGPIFNNSLNSIFCRLAIIENRNLHKYNLSEIKNSIYGSNNLQDLLFHSEVIVNVLKTIRDNSEYDNSADIEKIIDARKSIINEFSRLIKILPNGITMKELKGDIIFYPSGAKLLDERLVNDLLDWLGEYPKSHRSFTHALEKYQKKIYERNLLDDLRSSLEFFLKSYLNNNKTLENQKLELLKHMKIKNVSKEVRSMYQTLLDRYANYQNSYVKHEDNIKEEEIEFMIYLTGTFIRFLITLKEEKENNTK